MAAEWTRALRSVSGCRGGSESQSDRICFLSRRTVSIHYQGHQLIHYFDSLGGCQDTRIGSEQASLHHLFHSCCRDRSELAWSSHSPTTAGIIEFQLGWK